jgi:hypothetical protein
MAQRALVWDRLKVRLIKGDRHRLTIAIATTPYERLVLPKTRIVANR